MKQLKIFALLLIFCATSFAAKAEGDSYYSKTIGVNLITSFALADTLPEVGFGMGGGLFFDYRFNERFSIETETFFTTQDGSGRSSNENAIRFFAIPASTFKLYILANSKVEPYIGLGVGVYGLTEGDDSINKTGGFGLGAQLKAGLEYTLAPNLVTGLNLTYRSVGIINSLGQNASATTFMPFMFSASLGYRF